MTYFHCYREHRFNSAAQVTVDQANHIITEMQEQGYTLTLRQLYYQFVRRNWIANEEREYKRLGRLMTRGRESGVVDWLAIEDRGRGTYGTHPEEDPARILEDIEHGMIMDQWARQDHYLEVWVEKQALESVVARPCDQRHVTYMACKGYLSASEAWRAGLRFRDALDRGKTPVLIHLADHDPSGLNMTEDNDQRLNMFAGSALNFPPVQVRRIALNMDQVRRYDPPPNPAKESDSRSKEYVRGFGHSSWELDALEPSVLEDLILGTIDEYLDQDKWDEALEEEDEARKPLAALGRNWAAVEDFLRREDLL